MELTISNEILENFPKVKIGALIGKGIDNSAPASTVTSQLREEEERIRSRLQLEQLTVDPKIADWREAYRSFGCKPSIYRSSIEALLRRILQGKSLPSISPAVDLYNLISVRHTLAAGGDDLDKLSGGITLAIADGSETFIRLGQETAEPINQGEVVYRDEDEVLCRAWNYRECDKSKITPQTKNLCLIVEGLAHTTEEEVKSALADLEELLSAHCKGTYTQAILCKDFPSITI